MKAKFIPYNRPLLKGEELLKESIKHYHFMESRRTVREFSTEPVSVEVIENLVMAASTAPSGANKQPWTFCIVINPELKSKIRVEAEKEEYTNYHGRMPQEWLDDLSYLGTDWHKPFLEDAPALIIVFKKSYDLVNGKKKNNYYTTESVGLACGYLLQAIHQCGLVALTHTPSPMNFLIKVLNRPENEKPFLLIPVGYPATDVMVPDIKRKSKEEVLVYY
ncbi:nitroreductase family protein [Mucilaginibacter sp. OK098]|uniref:nitroreductase family protein n=1 Tax=Mucilaginibacter sp. OK098 TaxID=1855297 RepID=UPI0009209EDA|nr:nitroreductase family protein [Mucilaginibacter sp. OK098]SHN31554.1 Nitroreductase [Mucilaginibacter sp. OK098]